MHGIAQKADAFARMFSKWCASRGLTPAQGSVALGYSPDIGNKWAKGISTPPSTKLRLLADQMGLPVARVINAVITSRHSRLRARV